MQLGGPVWHVSVHTPTGDRSVAALRRIALRQLDGRGDARLGQWWEANPRRDTVHLRRRLSAVEQRAVGKVVDIRRTAEAFERAARLGHRLALISPDALADELGPTEVV